MQANNNRLVFTYIFQVLFEPRELCPCNFSLVIVTSSNTAIKYIVDCYNVPLPDIILVIGWSKGVAIFLIRVNVVMSFLIMVVVSYNIQGRKAQS